MSKDVKAGMKIEKGKNRGFSLIELITAVAILGILTVSVSYFMSTSSKTYDRLSVEAQLQSEAQLVANMITELAIDSYDVSKPAAGETFGYKSGDGKILILDSKADTTHKQYIIGLKEDKDELYLLEREYSAGVGGASGSWSNVGNEALLGDYIESFDVDTSRVKDENILRFTLVYKKGDRSYEGNYQVLMRNRAYADREKDPLQQEPTASLALRLSPQLIFVDIINEKVDGYYIDSVVEGAKLTEVSQGIEFKSTVISSQKNAGDTVNWELKNEDDKIFTMSSAEAAKSNLKWDTTVRKFKESPTDAFTLVITKSIDVGAEKNLEASPKTAQILLRRIKNVSLYATSGTTQWSSRYETEYGGKSDSEAQGYAYVGTNGRYLPVNLSAAISASNIAYGGGLTWELQTKPEDGSWGPCEKSLAKLATDETLTGTFNTVTLGSNVSNGQLFKVIATSVFDPSYKAEYVFGIAPTMTMNGDGFYSRGYYTDMSAFVDGQKPHNNVGTIDKLLYLKVQSIDGVGTIERDDDKAKVVMDENGNLRLIVDFDAFPLDGDQRYNFYVEKEEVPDDGMRFHLVLGYKGTDGKYYLVGKSSGNYKDDMAATVSNMLKQDGLEPITASDITAEDCDYEYVPKGVTVSKISPAQDVLVVEKGKDKDVYVLTQYYNILPPRRGTYYFGAYIDDMYNNLLEPGKGNVHEFFNVAMTSNYGDTDQYVDNASIRLTAKTSTEQRKYPKAPSVLRLTANDFYLISKKEDYFREPDGKALGSFTDYTVFIANVEEMTTYIPVPATYADDKEKNKYAGYIWPAEAETATKASPCAVKGIDTNGNVVNAQVYKEDGKYYCKYAGKTFTYSKVYNFWTE